MNNQEKYEYWLAYAHEDLRAAEAMFHAGRWFYVMFCCQQAVEKLTKGLYGLYVSFDKIPHIHNISRLINDFMDKIPQPITQEQFDFLDILTRYYLNNRYPDYVDDLLNQVNENNAKEVLAKTKEVFLWLQTLKP